MDGVKDTGEQPVFKADQGTDRQKGLDSCRARDRWQVALFELIDKEAKLNADENDHGQEKVLDNFAVNLNIVFGLVFRHFNSGI